MTTILENIRIFLEQVCSYFRQWGERCSNKFACWKEQCYGPLREKRGNVHDNGGLGTPTAGKYRDSGAGWFVFCNGRTVISADKSPKTGWNNNGLPIFQPKHRPFLGTVYFVSRHADRLPWDTTKSGINEDSEIWQEAKRRMVSVGRSITSFLDGRYADEGTEVAQKDLAEAARSGLTQWRPL